MNNKGFTLVELLVTITILGIITALAMPGVRRLTSTNSERKFEAYEKSVLSAAKLYVEDKAVDISFNVSECATIYMTNLQESKLIKAFSNDVDCLNPTNNSHVKVKRTLRDDNKYKYEYSVHLKCVTDVDGSLKDIYNTLSNTPVCY